MLLSSFFMKQIALFCAFVAPLLISISAAQAAEPRKLGKFDYWTAYQIADAKQPVCYMSLTAKPPIPKGSKLKRDVVTLMVTHRPAEGVLDVVSYTAGTRLAPSSEVTVQDDSGKVFNLFTQNDTAWARDPAADRALTMSLRAANKVTFTGTAASGGSFADTISMKGSSKAYRAMTEACGLSAPSNER